MPDNEFRRYPRLDKDNPQFVKYTLQYRAVFRTDFELKTFPFDSQQLQILIKIRRPYQLDETVRAIRSTLRACKFNLEQVERTDFRMLPNPEFLAGRSGDVSKFAISLRIQRRFMRYMIEVALSHFALSLICWAAILFTPPSHTGYRSQVVLAILFISLAFKFISSTALPQLPDFTALEMYAHALWCFNIVMLLYVQIIGGICRSSEPVGSSAATAMDSSTYSEANSYASAAIAFADHGKERTEEIEAAVLITLGVLWAGVHLYVIRFVVRGLQRFAKNRHENMLSEKNAEMQIERQKRTSVEYDRGAKGTEQIVNK